MVPSWGSRLLTGTGGSRGDGWGLGLGALLVRDPAAGAAGIRNPGIVLCLARAVSEFGATLMFAGNFAGRTRRRCHTAIMAALETDLSAALALAVLLVGIAAAVLVLSRVVAGPLGRPVSGNI